MRTAAYRIIDEPRPGALAQLATDPMWVFLALVMGGPWIGFPWFIVNGMAVGSARLKREVVLAVVGWAGLAVLVVVSVFAATALEVPSNRLHYLRFLFFAWRGAFGYLLHFSQARSFELFRYYGGRPRRAWLVAVGSVFVGQSLAAALFKLPFGWFFALVLT